MLPRFAPFDAQDAGLAQDLHALLQAAHGEAARELALDPAAYPPLQRTAHALQLEEASWIGAWDEDRLVGALALHADPEDPVVLRIGELAVRPGWQRRGIATLLLHAAHHSQGPRAVFRALLAEPLEGARALLQAQGYREQRRWREQGLRWVLLCRMPG